MANTIIEVIVPKEKLLVEVSRGVKGARGVSISDAVLNENGHFIVTYDNGEIVDSGIPAFVDAVMYRDEAKGYSEQAGEYATSSQQSSQDATSAKNAAEDSETKAKQSETNAKTSETNAETSETNAKASETSSASHDSNAASSATSAGKSATNAAQSAESAAGSATTATNQSIAAANSATTAGTKATDASNSATASANSAQQAQEYAESMGAAVNSISGNNNGLAIESISGAQSTVTLDQMGLGIVYKFKGSVATYADLPSTGVSAGWVYNVVDTGKDYAYTPEGTWDDLGGTVDLSSYSLKTDTVKAIAGSSAVLTITKGDGTTSTITVNNVANATHATTADSATTATSADLATKATQDGSGNVISSFYLPKSGGSVTGNINLNNSVGILGKGTSGSLRNIAYIGDNNYVYIGDESELLMLRSGSRPQWLYGSTAKLLAMLDDNVASATILANARTFSITGGATGTAQSFNGSSDVAIPVTSLDATKLTGTAPVDTTGNAATATTLQDARTIALSGKVTGTATSFNGSANISIPVTAVTADTCTGNSATATKWQTARKIGGVSVDGSADIDLPGVNKAGTQDTSGNAATATNANNDSNNQNISSTYIKGLAADPSSTDLTYTKGDGTTGTVSNFGRAILNNLASNVLASTISSITSDSLMAKLVKLVFNATGVQYNIAQNGYVKFGSFFGGLIIQWGTGTFNENDASKGGTETSLPISMSNAYVAIACDCDYGSDSIGINVNISSIHAWARNASGYLNTNYYFFVIGS